MIAFAIGMRPTVPPATVVPGVLAAAAFAAVL